MTEIVRYLPKPEGERTGWKGDRPEGFGVRLADAAIGLVHGILLRLEGDSWLNKDYFEGRVTEETAFEPISLDIFRGGMSTLDGLIANTALEGLLPNSDIRHRIITTGPDSDGIAGTHIGTLAGARKKARRILLKRADLIEGVARPDKPKKVKAGENY